MNPSYPPVVYVTHFLTSLLAEFVSCSALLYALLLLHLHLRNSLSSKIV
jgi:hypothetical protein